MSDELPELPDDASFSLYEQGKALSTDAFLALSAQGLPIAGTEMDHDANILTVTFNDEADGLRMDIQLESALHGVNTMGGYRMWMSHLVLQVAARFQEIAPYAQQRRKLKMDEDMAIQSIMRSARKTR